MRQTAPFLNSIGWREPISRAASSPIAGSWPTSAMRALRACFSRSAMTAAKLPSGRERVDVDERRPRVEAGGDDLRRLPRADERAREHDVDRHAEAREPARRLPQRATCPRRSAAAWCRRATPRRAPRRARDESGTARRVPASTQPARRVCARIVGALRLLAAPFGHRGERVAAAACSARADAGSRPRARPRARRDRARRSTFGGVSDACVWRTRSISTCRSCMRPSSSWLRLQHAQIRAAAIRPRPRPTARPRSAAS